MGRLVETAYGPAAGCPDCEVIVLGGEPHICEHGVTPAPSNEVEISMTFDDPDLYDRLAGLRAL